MHVAALITGGKDSLYATMLAMKKGHIIECLVSMRPKRADSWMFHYPNIHLTNLLSDATGIPLILVETSGIKEEELEDLKRVLARLDIDGVVSGAIASRYQKIRINRICRELGLKSITPLWQRDPAKLLAEMIDADLKIIITAVAALGLDETWLGRRLDKKALSDLIKLSNKYGINVCGDGGEMETLVLDAPIFKKSIKILKAKRVWEGDSGYLLIEGAKLVNKS